MIRFRCQCGKKLKADASIVGKKVRCTRCEKVNRVPESSTAEPGRQSTLSAANDQPNPAPSQPSAIVLELDAPETGNVSLLADAASEENSFDFDPSLIDFDEPTAASPTTPLLQTESKTETQEPSLNPFKIDTAIKSDTKTKPGIPKHIWMLLLYFVGGLVSIGGLGLLIVWLMSGPTRFPESFEKLESVKHYRYCLMQYDRSHRSLKLMADAYVKAKPPGEEEVQQINQLVSQSATFADRQATLEKAWQWVEQGEEAKARKFLAEESAKLLAKRPELEFKAKEFMEKSK